MTAIIIVFIIAGFSAYLAHKYGEKECLEASEEEFNTIPNEDDKVSTAAKKPLKKTLNAQKKAKKSKKS